jgi:hypothetical protein
MIYEAPIIKIAPLSLEDVIRTSGLQDDELKDDEVPDSGWL